MRLKQRSAGSDLDFPIISLPVEQPWIVLIGRKWLIKDTDGSEGFEKPLLPPAIRESLAWMPLSLPDT